MNAVEKRKAGMASSMLNIVQQVGGSVGIAVLSLVLARRSAYHLSILGGDVATSSPAYREAAAGFFARARELGYSHIDGARAAGNIVGRYVGSTASVMGFQDAFLAGSAITLATLFFVFLLPAKPATHARPEPVHLE
jgi:DHA2 family multidrug resistance protein